MSGPTPPPYRPPGSEMAARVWLRTLPVLAGAGIGSNLPPIGAWPGGFYIQTTSLPGPADTYLPTREAVVQVDAWCGPDEWERAGVYIDSVFYACYRRDVYGTYPADVAGYDAIALKSVTPHGDPRKVTGDPAGYARWSLDLAITFLPATLAY